MTSDYFRGSVCECGKDRWQISLKPELGLGFKRTVTKKRAPTAELAALYFKQRLEDELTEREEMRPIDVEVSVQKIIDELSSFLEAKRHTHRGSIIKTAEMLRDASRRVRNREAVTAFKTAKSAQDKVSHTVKAFENEGDAETTNTIRRMLTELVDVAYSDEEYPIGEHYHYPVSLHAVIANPLPDDPSATVTEDWTMRFYCEKSTGDVYFLTLEATDLTKVKFGYYYSSTSPTDRRLVNKQRLLKVDAFADREWRGKDKIDPRIKALQQALRSPIRLEAPTEVHTPAPTPATAPAETAPSTVAELHEKIDRLQDEVNRLQDEIVQRVRDQMMSFTKDIDALKKKGESIDQIASTAATTRNRLDKLQPAVNGTRDFLKTLNITLPEPILKLLQEADELWAEQGPR